MRIRAALKSRQAKWITTAVVLLVNLAGWVIPSNVTYLIAQNRDVLLGRYSLGHLTTLLILILVSAIWLYLAWANEQNEKQRKFKVAAILISVFVSLVVMDIAARLILKRRYVAAPNYYHRPPNTVETGTAKDVPEEAFLYPRTPPGHPDIEYTLTVDKRGFRNKTDLEQYDIVVLGDSFAEGSRVSDEQAWPVLLGRQMGLSVYNLGMSAGHPGTYLATLKRFGPELSPKTVICMLYEGNDFRDDNFRKETFADHAEEYFKTSPLRNAIKRLLVRCFASADYGAADSKGKGRKPPGEAPAALSWLPVAVPGDPNGKYYAFKVKRLCEHYTTEDEFLSRYGTKQTFAALRRIKSVCDQLRARLIVAYAPDKPHLLMPLITQVVSSEQIRAFMALRRRDLPPAEQLIETLLWRLEVWESAFRDFCRAESIEFVSLTEPLRCQTARGVQTYFTYDQHWTPSGQRIVAGALAQCMGKSAQGPER